MAAIMTWFCKATPAGVFAVCPFLLFWLAICPNRAHAHGRPLPPLLRCRPFLRRETAKGVRSHTGCFFAGALSAVPEVSRIMRRRIRRRNAGTLHGDTAPILCRDRTDGGG